MGFHCNGSTVGARGLADALSREVKTDVCRTGQLDRVDLLLFRAQFCSDAGIGGAILASKDCLYDSGALAEGQCGSRMTTGITLSVFASYSAKPG